MEHASPALRSSKKKVVVDIYCLFSTVGIKIAHGYNEFIKDKSDDDKCVIGNYICIMLQPSWVAPVVKNKSAIPDEWIKAVTPMVDGIKAYGSYALAMRAMDGYELTFFEYEFIIDTATLTWKKRDENKAN